MSNTVQILVEIQKLLDLCSEALQNLNPENFDTNFNLAVTNFQKVKDLRKQIPEKINSPELEEKLKKIVISTKLIEKDYDNVIRNYYTEIDKIQSDIRNINKKRKLARYSKGEI